MITRSQCLYNGNIIGIETIYTVIDGKQINNPEKITWLRKLSDNKELYCPCGCGTHLTLVAGDRGLKAQHFRILKGDENKFDCRVTDEGEIYIDSRIVLKCWLEDKLSSQNVLCKIQAKTVAESDRKYEYTAYDKDNNIGVCFWKNRFNIEEEKIQLLNESALKVFYFVGEFNEGSTGQYPENMMKIQYEQGFNLYLALDGDRGNLYNKSKVRVTQYVQNIDGLWEELSVAEDLISNFQITKQGHVLLNGRKLLDLCTEVNADFQDEQEAEKERRRVAEENRRKIEQKRLQQQEEYNKRIEEENIKFQKLKEERRAKEERLAAEKKEKELQRKREQELEKQEFHRKLPELLDQQDNKVIDSDGVRWIKCENCGKVYRDSEFHFYGGPGSMNLGLCKECENIGLKHNDFTECIIQENKLISANVNEIKSLLPKVLELCIRTKRPQKALDIAKQYTEEHKKKVWTPKLLILIAESYYELNEIETARQFANLAETISIDKENPELVSIMERLR